MTFRTSQSEVPHPLKLPADPRDSIAALQNDSEDDTSWDPALLDPSP